MNKLFTLTLAALAAVTLSATASAQVVSGPIITSYRPITEQAPTVTYSPVVESAPTTTNYAPQARTVYYQAPITVARPVIQRTTAYAPVVTYRPAAPVVTYRPAAPVVTYRPVARAYYAAPAPVITYRQPVTAYAPPLPAYAATTYSAYPTVAARPVAVATPVVVGRPVIVRTKVYVPGQPVRNVLRAITP